VSAPLRIVFLGTADFAVPTLTALSRTEHTIVGVFTRPDRPAGRGRHLRPPPVKVAAEGLALPVCQPPRVSLGEGLAHLRALAPDLIVTVAYGEILRGALAPPGAEHPRLAAAELPGRRQSAALLGETVTGVTSGWQRAGCRRHHLQRSRRGRGFGSLRRLARLAVRWRGAVALIVRGERRLAQNAAEATFAPPSRKTWSLIRAPATR
jgi:hypothetical protein